MTPERAVAIADYLVLYFVTPSLFITGPVAVCLMAHVAWRNYQADKKEQQQ